MSKQLKRKKSRIVATVAACAAVGTQGLVARGQVPQPGQTAVDSVAQQHTFAIPAGTLAEALEAYRQTSGVTVRVHIPTGADQMLSPGLTGTFSDQDALTQLLAGTALTVKFTSTRAALVTLEHSEAVDVTSTLPDEVAMTKFTQPLVDTPQTVAVIPHFVLEDEGVTTLRDTLRNVPGISLAAGESGAQGDNLTIRGFTARNDIFLDGIRDFGSYYRDSFDYEQVEVLEGPAGVQFGRGSTGGVINQETKVPRATPLVDLNGQFGTNITRRVAVDINEPLPMLGSGTALRINGMVNDGGVAERPYASVSRFGVAPSLEFGMNSSTRFILSYQHLDENDTPDYGLPWFYNQLAPGVNRSSYYGFPGTNHLNTEDDIITGRLEHVFNDHITVHSIARAANYPRSAQITEPQICSNASVSTPVGSFVSALPTSSLTGKACPYVPGVVNPASILVNRNQIQIKSVEGDLWDQTEAMLRFKTRGIRHELTAGVEGGQEISNPIKSSYTYGGLNVVPSTTLLNPNVDQLFSGTPYITSVVHTKAESVGLYFLDTIHLSRKFELSGGVRWDRFDTSYNAYQPAPLPAGAAATSISTVGTFSRVDAQPTYRAALVYKPNNHGSVYFDYGTSFNPSAESLALTSITQNVAPEENETYEVGAKYSFLSDKLMTETAVFRTEKDNARETDPTNSNNIVVAGNQLVKGFQSSVIGRLPQGMDLVAGYAYLSSDVIYSKFYPASVGYQLANVPKQTFNLFMTHRLPGRVTAGFGGNYVASRTASSTTPYVPLTFSPPMTIPGTTTAGYKVLSTAMKQVPGYWVFNAMAKRPISEHFEVQANVNNLLNRFFIDEPHPSHLIPGEGLNALIGMNLKF